jgi:hypothetical protein
MSDDTNMGLDHCLAEVLLERSPWCMLVPTSDPTDPDIIGPFWTYENAKHWQAELGKTPRWFLWRV